MKSAIQDSGQQTSLILKVFANSPDRTILPKLTITDQVQVRLI
jgi:hypothetical protein